MKKKEGDKYTPTDDEYHLNSNLECVVKTCEATHTLSDSGGTCIKKQSSSQDPGGSGNENKCKQL